MRWSFEDQPKPGSIPTFVTIWYNSEGTTCESIQESENAYKGITSNKLREMMGKIWSDLFILMDRRAIQNVRR